MTDRDALYRAILAHPDDDTPRLVYADWLEENGRAEEAEFIRVECRLEAGHPDDPDHVELCDRREELRLWLAAHVTGPEVRLPARLRLEGGADWWNATHRGFPRFLEYEGLPVSLPTGLKAIRALAAALDKAFERVPTRWLSVWSITVAELAELLRHAAVSGLNHLTIHVNPAHEPQDEACRLIADCPHLAKLRGLYLRFPVDDAGAAALAGSKNLLGLRKLALDRVAMCSPVGVRALGTAGWFQSLHGLELSELEETSFEELCRVAPLPNLHTLELREAGFATASWHSFARSKSFPRLSRLIHSGEMFSGQMEALAETEHLRLAVLDLAGSSIGNDGARTLAAAPWLDSLRWLGLSYNLITASGFTAIAGCRKFIALRHLDLSNNSPGARGLRELASNPALRGLTSLLLNGTLEDSRGLNSVQFQQFFNDLDMPNLRRLELTRRPLGARAARALTASKYSSLTRLNLDQCKLTDAAMAALVSAPALQNLIEFDAAQNGLKSGVEALTNRKVMPRLAAANFSSNRIGRDLARKLKRRPGVYA